MRRWERGAGTRKANQSLAVAPRLQVVGGVAGV